MSELETFWRRFLPFRFVRLGTRLPGACLAASQGSESSSSGTTPSRLTGRSINRDNNVLTLFTALLSRSGIPWWYKMWVIHCIVNKSSIEKIQRHFERAILSHAKLNFFFCYCNEAYNITVKVAMKQEGIPDKWAAIERHCWCSVWRSATPSSQHSVQAEDHHSSKI